MVNWSLRKAPPPALGKRKAAVRMGKMSVGRSMNVERETETLNRARQLVFNNDNLATQGHLGCHPSYHPGGNVGDPTLPFRSVYPPRMFSGHVLGSSGSSQYPQQNLNYLGAPESNYTCIGAPVGHGLGAGSNRPGGGGTGGRDVSLSNQEEGLNWGRRYAGGTQHRLENPSAINQFQDGDWGSFLSFGHPQLVWLGAVAIGEGCVFVQYHANCEKWGLKLGGGTS
ncbi:hypothetical protein GOBAR_AA07997 [Gossypium barbadense]|uniref:Uncharacterized protein n=1 Tax=Gossypium barbadense TaxID=3634 RepID=A0A2P5YAL6_GOSBA|nr:hypothetical protein GOBAR_AA07997 [Gossypium barbadense]